MSTVLTMTAALAAPASFEAANEVGYVDYYSPVTGPNPVALVIFTIFAIVIVASWFVPKKERDQDRAMKLEKEEREKTRFEWDKKDRESGSSQNYSYKNKNSYKNKKKNYKK